jgi:putative hydrolase of the HAD superfamily
LRASLGSSVDGFCFSFEVGVVKPESAFFARLCREVGCEPGLALMVGDSFRSDIQGARASGMQAIHLNRGLVDVSPGSVRSLAELADRLERNRLGFES